MSKARILIVDDDPLTVDGYNQALREDYHLIVVLDASKALELVNHQPPDLIILDLRMPQIDGYQLARYFRIQPNTASVPILVLSSFITAETEPRLQVLGRIKMLDKPIEPLELQAAVKLTMQL